MKDSKNFWNRLDTKKLNKPSTMISINYKTANKVLNMINWYLICSQKWSNFCWNVFVIGDFWKCPCMWHYLDGQRSVVVAFSPLYEWNFRRSFNRLELIDFWMSLRLILFCAIFSDEDRSFWSRTLWIVASFALQKSCINFFLIISKSSLSLSWWFFVFFSMSYWCSSLAIWIRRIWLILGRFACKTLTATKITKTVMLEMFMLCWFQLSNDCSEQKFHERIFYTITY